MKSVNFYLFFLLELVYVNLNTAIAQEEKTFQKDTIGIIFETDYSNYDLGSDFAKLTLIKSISIDSILTFDYYLDSLNSKTLSYSFDLKKDFFMIQDSSEQFGLSEVETFSEILGDEIFVFKKYEKLNPPIDGHEGLIFNEIYGLVISVSYSWLNHRILVQFGESILKEDLENLLHSKKKEIRTESYQRKIPPKPKKQK